MCHISNPCICIPIYIAPEDRKALDAIEAPAWPAALQAYLSDLGGDVRDLTGKAAAPDSKVAREIVADWLLSYAIGMEYSDRADMLSKLQAPPASPASAPGAGTPSAAQPKKTHVSAAPAQAPAVQIQLDVDTPEFRKSLEGACARARVCVRMYVCVRMCVYTLAHTHTRTHIRASRYAGAAT